MPGVEEVLILQPALTNNQNQHLSMHRFRFRPGGGAAIPRVMMLGADVTHPTNLPEQARIQHKIATHIITRCISQAGNSSEVNPNRPRPDKNSVAAVVGSIDAHCMRYAARVMAQEPLQENVVGMKEAVLSLLKEYYNNHLGALPDTILMFR